MLFLLWIYLWRKVKRRRENGQISTSCVKLIGLGICFINFISLCILTCYLSAQNQVTQPLPQSDISQEIETFLLSPTQKFTAIGQDINCKQKRIITPSDFDEISGNGKFAYVWYGASMQYICSALTALRMLKRRRLDETLIVRDSHLQYMYVVSLSTNRKNCS